MRPSPSIPTICLVGALTAMWCVLWGEVTFANVASGLVLASVAVAALGSRNVPRRSIRPVPLATFLGVVAVDLVKSTLAVALEVLTPTDRTDEAIIVVDPGPGGTQHPLLMSVAVTITPGTGVVDIDPDSGRLYLHLLHARRAPAVTAHVQRLNRLANAALPSVTVAHREAMQ